MFSTTEPAMFPLAKDDNPCICGSIMNLMNDTKINQFKFNEIIQMDKSMFLDHSLLIPPFAIYCVGSL